VPKIGSTGTWERRDVKLWTGPTLEEARFVTYKGVQVHGGFAVHPHVDNPAYWSISHVKSGYHVVTVKAESDAKRIAEWVWRRYCLVFRKGTKEELVEAAPKPLTKWIKHCGAERKWIDPPKEIDR